MLTYSESRRTCLVYLEPDGEEVYLAHGSFQRLVPFWDIDLPESWSEWCDIHGSYERDEWKARLRASTSEPEYVTEVVWCESCDEPVHTDNANPTRHGWVCESCAGDSYAQCVRCDLWDNEGSTALDDEWYCALCIRNYFAYCDDCEGYYRAGDDDHNHDESCNCESPQLWFTVRNDGLPPLAQDQRTTITLPGGEISEEGLGEIARCLYSLSYTMDDATQRQALYSIAHIDALTEHIGVKWQTGRGNFTKRLSRYCYNELKIKLDAATISHIGNIASAHSQAVDFQIEVTRDLNLSPEDFGNEGSCWWGSYTSSRCALKSNGGFGLRSFDGPYDVSGRAWVLPLKLSGSLAPRLIATFETVDPAAFVVFNGYGAMDGYIPARILAHMAGMTYRKIDFSAEPMYINAGGYLIAPEELATHYTDGSLNLSLHQHATLFDNEQADRKELTNVA